MCPERRTANDRDAIDLSFLGTRGEIDIRSRAHYRHSTLLVQSRETRILIDCGADWLHRFECYRPTAVLVTHAHPDHAWGLADGAPCPVYATRKTHLLLADCYIRDRQYIAPDKMHEIDGVCVEAFPVRHSLRAPAVGYRVSRNANHFFYVPDVVSIVRRGAALRGIQVYIGDGATVQRPLIRRRGRSAIGHTPISTQLGWCEAEGVPVAVFTHCGTEIVGGDGRSFNAAIRRDGRAHGVDARLAHDGLQLRLSGGKLFRNKIDEIT